MLNMLPTGKARMQYPKNIYPRVSVCNHPGVDKYERRQMRLAELMAERCGGSPTALAREIGRDSSYVSRMLYPPGKKGRKRIGEDMADAITLAFGLPHGWMDSGPSGGIREPPPMYTSKKRKIAHLAKIAEGLTEAQIEESIRRAEDAERHNREVIAQLATCAESPNGDGAGKKNAA